MEGRRVYLNKRIYKIGADLAGVDSEEAGAFVLCMFVEIMVGWDTIGVSIGPFRNLTCLALSHLLFCESIFASLAWKNSFPRFVSLFQGGESIHETHVAVCLEVSAVGRMEAVVVQASVSHMLQGPNFRVEEGRPKHFRSLTECSDSIL